MLTVARDASDLYLSFKIAQSPGTLAIDLSPKHLICRFRYFIQNATFTILLKSWLNNYSWYFSLNETWKTSCSHTRDVTLPASAVYWRSQLLTHAPSDILFSVTPSSLQITPFFQRQWGTKFDLRIWKAARNDIRARLYIWPLKARARRVGLPRGAATHDDTCILSTYMCRARSLRGRLLTFTRRYIRM